MSNMVTKKQDPEALQLLSRAMPLVKPLLPVGMDPARLFQVIRNEFQANPALANCDPVSVVGSVMRLAQLGLEPNKLTGQCYLIPRKGICHPETGYRGEITLLHRSDKIRYVSAQVVYEGEPFDYQEGTDRYIRHKPLGLTADSARITHAYAIAELTNGGINFVVLPKIKIDYHKSFSQNQKPGGPWDKHYDAMAKKTAILQLKKVLPMDLQSRELDDTDPRQFALDCGVEPPRQQPAPPLEALPESPFAPDDLKHLRLRMSRFAIESGVIKFNSEIFQSRVADALEEQQLPVSRWREVADALQD